MRLKTDCVLGIRQWGLEVPDRRGDRFRKSSKKAERFLSKPEADAVEFRGPDGNIAVIVGPGGF